MKAQQLAFPEAEGFGKYASGARNVSTPQVYHVTNLNDSGTGSFRDAVSQPGRIVVFDVSGVIKVNSRIVFSANSYIAGQTAPGDGVILYGDGVSFSGANNLIVRYLRIYMGKNGTSGKDASGIANGSDMIFDHLSVMWGLDENFSVNWDSKGTEPANITIQNSIIGQGIMTHSAGGLIQTNGGVSIIGCLYVDNKTRNPKIKGLNQFINNVVYNWGGSDGYIMGDTEASSWAWCEGNYFISGPNSGSSPFTRATSSYQIFHNDNNNYVDGNKNGIIDGVPTTTSSYGSATTVTSPGSFAGIPGNHPAMEGGVLSPQQSLEKVIASAGASLPARVAPDDFVIGQLLSYGTEGALITHENNNGIYQNVGIVSGGSKPADSDNDGIPDAWETANGLNPADKTDAVVVAENGYLHIENYINSIDAPVAPYVRCASYLQMTRRTINSISLAWKNNALQSDNILLQKSTNGSAYETIATLPASSVSYDVTGLPEETSYYFRIVTRNGVMESSPSEILKVATEGTPKVPSQSINPSPETGAISRFYTEVTFAWENETGPWAGEVNYEIYFGASPDNLAKIAGPLSGTSYIYQNAGMTMNSTCYWRVDAVNSLGTTPGPVWNFVAGTYSFTSTLVDVGKDFNGSSTVVAQSGSTLTTGAKSYTVFSGTPNEMRFTVSGGTVGESDGSYMAKGTSKIQYFDLTSSSHYVEASLTANSSGKNIAYVEVNGTSSDVGTVIYPVVLFSDKQPFSSTSIIGYEEISLPEARKGMTGIELTAPVGSKSFRVYRSVTLSTVGEDVFQIGGTVNPVTVGSSGKNPRIPYLSATLELLSDDRYSGIGDLFVSGIKYFSNVLENPGEDTLDVFGISGIPVLSTRKRATDLSFLPAGVYIARSDKGEVIRFLK